MSTAEHEVRLRAPRPRTSPEDQPAGELMTCFEQDVLPRLVRLGYTLVGAVGSCPPHGDHALEQALEELDEVTRTVRTLVVQGRHAHDG